MSVIIDTTMSEVESVIKYARYGANNCMIANSWEIKELVRCKDCKHYVIHVLFGHRQGWCERLCDEFDKSLARGTGDDDFCSRGERRSE